MLNFYHCFLICCVPDNGFIKSRCTSNFEIFVIYFIYILTFIEVWKLISNADDRHISRSTSKSISKQKVHENHNLNLSIAWLLFTVWMRENVFLSGGDWFSGGKWFSNHDNNKQRYSHYFQTVLCPIRHGIIFLFFRLDIFSIVFFIFIYRYIAIIHLY